MVLLVLIGTALIIESFLRTETAALVPVAWWPLVAFDLGLAIALVSSLLGVAGGELIIPSFVFPFGAPIKVAGTASLLVSLPTVWDRALLAARRLRRPYGAAADRRTHGRRLGDRGGPRWTAPRGRSGRRPEARARRHPHLVRAQGSRHSCGGEG